ncbi:MAG: CvpA family protein [bacterium]|nr:CvpA family protein [bacterium]
MDVNIIDIIIVILLIMGAIMGFQDGVIKKTTSFIGMLVVVFLSFTLKSTLSAILYNNLPFFNFWGHLSGLTSLNILLYETIAFLLLLIIFGVILSFLVKLSGLLEKLLKMTVVLTIPSKILGIFVGFIEMFLWIYIILFILSLPAFNLKVVNESKYTNKILNTTPVLNEFAKTTVSAYDEVYGLIEQHTNENTDYINGAILDRLLNYKIVSATDAQGLVDKNKLKIPASNDIIGKYR